VDWAQGIGIVMWGTSGKSMSNRLMLNVEEDEVRR